MQIDTEIKPQLFIDRAHAERAKGFNNHPKRFEVSLPLYASLQRIATPNPMSGVYYDMNFQTQKCSLYCLGLIILPIEEIIFPRLITAGNKIEEL
ncbi:hypothetical protein [Undibacterium danionis]|uniref:Uncharacterized protein n=1 Tax=Undibacterium danionis TaxID=1812100 RepID=A0ABV6ICZ9_9BURK